MLFGLKAKRIVLYSKPAGLLLAFALTFTFPRNIEASAVKKVGGNNIIIGPETYRAIRTREGGTKQVGWLFGMQLGYERIKRCCFYYGIDGYWAQGQMKGHNGFGDYLTSCLTDTQIEGRVGYTWQLKHGSKGFLTPFVGFGYFYEKNEFHAPSPIILTYRDSFKYVLAGFLTGASLSTRVDLFGSFKAKYSLDGKSFIADDPDRIPTTLRMEDEFQWRVDFGTRYRLFKGSKRSYLIFAPFYEFRHYGGHIAFPYDYKDTRFQIWGMQLDFDYRF